MVLYLIWLVSATAAYHFLRVRVAILVGAFDNFFMDSIGIGYIYRPLLDELYVGKSNVS